MTPPTITAEDLRKVDEAARVLRRLAGDGATIQLWVHGDGGVHISRERGLWPDDGLEEFAVAAHVEGELPSAALARRLGVVDPAPATCTPPSPAETKAAKGERFCEMARRAGTPPVSMMAIGEPGDASGPIAPVQLTDLEYATLVWASGSGDQPDAQRRSVSAAAGRLERKGLLLPFVSPRKLTEAGRAYLASAAGGPHPKGTP